MTALLKCQELKLLISKFQISNKQSKSLLKILDCTYPSKRGVTNFKQERIDNARYLDIGKLKDTNSNLTMEFPQPNQLKTFIDNLQISKKDTIVCYDQYGIYSSPRAWFIFKAYGFNNVSVLDGGLPKWKQLGYEINTNPITDEEVNNFSYFEKVKDYQCEKSDYDKNLLTKYEEIVQMVKESSNKLNCIIDTRPNSFFKIQESIPSSVNIPFDQFTNRDGTLKSKEEIGKIFSDNKVDLSEENNIVSSCGIGLSACLGVFITKEVLGHNKVQLYNGSLEEYLKKKTRKENII